jgi:hypothetical protein
MTYTPITVARGTTKISSDQRIVNMDKAIKLLEPDATPFTTLTMQLSKKPTGDPKYKSAEDELKPRFDAINDGGGYVAGDTALTVDNGEYFAEHDLVLITRTGEVIRVTQVVSDVLTVVRGVGSTAAAINNDDELLIIGSAQPEGDVSRTPVSANPTTITNYTQIQRDSWEVTGTALASENETTPHDWDHQAKKVGIQHKRAIENSFLFGKPSENTSGTQARRTTGGLLYHISTNATDASGTLTETEFNTAMRSGFRYGSKRKTLFVAPLVGSVLDGFPAGKHQIQSSGKATGEYGVTYNTFTTRFGSVNVVTHWELEGTKYGGYAIGVDMNNVSYRYLKNAKANRDSKVFTEIQAPDQDSRRDEWRTECGLQVDLEKSHFVITGVTG